MNKLAVARIAPPTINGSAIPAPVFGIEVPSTLDESLGAGVAADVSVGVADAEALGDDPPGRTPPPPEPDGDGEADGEAEALGEVCACSAVDAVAADVIKRNRPVASDITASTPRTRGNFRIGGLLSPLYVCPVTDGLCLIWGDFSFQVQLAWKVVDDDEESVSAR